jgi:hypothetical protein
VAKVQRRRKNTNPVIDIRAPFEVDGILYCNINIVGYQTFTSSTVRLDECADRLNAIAAISSAKEMIAMSKLQQVLKQRSLLDKGLDREILRARQGEALLIRCEPTKQ